MHSINAIEIRIGKCYLLKQEQKNNFFKSETLWQQAFQRGLEKNDKK